MTPRLSGAAIALATLLVDQAFKLWAIFGFDMGARGRVPLMPGLDMVMAWNPGVSYSLFSARTPLGRWILLAVALGVTTLLGVWLSRATTRPTAFGLGLIIGGALGNAVDRFAYGAVADFFHAHAGAFSWYVFNLADVAIVAGVALLLYEALLGTGSRASAAT